MSVLLLHDTETAGPNGRGAGTDLGEQEQELP